jgi:RNA polymerase sigma-70 factor (ECF subfamily)
MTAGVWSDTPPSDTVPYVTEGKIMTPGNVEVEARPAITTRNEALVSRLRAGEDAAFEELVRTYTARLLAVARRILGSHEEAKDVVQETFLAAFQSLDRFRGEANLGTWLSRIAVNQCLMKLRSRKRKPEQSIEELLPRFLPDGHQVRESALWGVSFDTEVERKEVHGLVRQAINRLPERYRTVLLLRDIEELSTEEVAGTLGVTSNTIKVRLHRARQALRTLLEPHFRPNPSS